MNRTMITMLVLCLTNSCPSGSALASTGSSRAPDKASSKATSPSGATSAIDEREEAVRKVLHHIGMAVSAGDVAGLTSLWAEDALLVDDRGEETQGRAALQERFSNAIGEPGSSTVELHPERISFPADKVCAIVGCICRKLKNHVLPTARFSMLLEKHDNAWLVQQVTETPMLVTTAADHLKELEWLIGTWKIDEPGNSAKLEIEWGSTHSFIIIKTVRNRDGVDEVDTQIIGWDPRKKELVSWHFGNRGGFGYGQWSRQGESWEVQFVGVGHGGNTTRATDIFTQKNPNEFTWQATQQSSDDAAIVDGDLIVVTKVR